MLQIIYMAPKSKVLKLVTILELLIIDSQELLDCLSELSVVLFPFTFRLRKRDSNGLRIENLVQVMVDIGLEEKFDFVFIFLGFAFGGNSKL